MIEALLECLNNNMSLYNIYEYKNKNNKLTI